MPLLGPAGRGSEQRRLRRHRQLIAALRCLGAAGILILAAGTLAGCGCTSLIERDTPVSRSLERRLSEFSRTGPDGATRRLDELADFRWDRLHIFVGELTSYREINTAVGEKVWDGCGTGPLAGHESYLIFTLRGKVVHAVSVLSTDVAGEQADLSAERRHQGRRALPRTLFLELVDRSAGSAPTSGAGRAPHPRRCPRGLRATGLRRDLAQYEEIENELTWSEHERLDIARRRAARATTAWRMGRDPLA